MDDFSDASPVPLQVTHGCLVASIQHDLDGDVLARFRRDLLHRIQTERIRGVLLDVAGMEVIDAAEFEELQRILAMAQLMGYPPVLVGLRPGVVAALVDLGVDVRGVRTVLTLEDGFALLHGDSGRSPGQGGRA